MPAGGVKLLANVLGQQRIYDSRSMAEKTPLSPERLPSVGGYGRFSIMRPEMGVSIGWNRIQRNLETRAAR